LLPWQVEEVKGIMHDSINEMLATRDNLEVRMHVHVHSLLLGFT
tara:strand:- start:549 stop:680 length:132 start_codon:yes stop_codon:yes gene_type:complete